MAHKIVEQTMEYMDDAIVFEVYEEFKDTEQLFRISGGVGVSSIVFWTGFLDFIIPVPEILNPLRTDGYLIIGIVLFFSSVIGVCIVDYKKNKKLKAKREKLKKALQDMDEYRRQKKIIEDENPLDKKI